MYGFLLFFIQFVSIFLLFLSGPVTPNNIFSLTLIVLGSILGIYAIWTVKLWNVRILPHIDKNIDLVITGPYRIIRHPMYTAVLLIGLSMVLNDMSHIRVGIYSALVINQLLKIQYEEKLLEDHFTKYASYKKTTKKLLPFIY